MDDFRKQYEYTEEKRGFILLFIIMLITIDIYQATLYIFPAYSELKQNPALRILFMVVSSLYALLIPYTAITCFRLKRNLATISKVYLIMRAIVMTCCIIIFFIYNVNFKSKMGFGRQYSTIGGIILEGLIAPILFVLVFSAGWYVYFIKSKRCKELAAKLPSE